MTEFSIV